MSLQEKESRLKQLMHADFLSDDEITEREKLTEELGLVKQETPLKLAPEIIKSLGTQLQNLKNERKALELQSRIRIEQEKIKRLKEGMDKKQVWCEECGEFVDAEH